MTLKAILLQFRDNLNYIITCIQTDYTWIPCGILTALFFVDAVFCVVGIFSNTDTFYCFLIRFSHSEVTEKKATVMRSHDSSQRTKDSSVNRIKTELNEPAGYSLCFVSLFF